MDKEIIRRIRKLNQLYAYTSIQMHETVGRQAGISGTDHKYLGFLVEKGQMTAGEFASMIGLTTGAVTGLIDRFEKKKLVKRQFVEGDRRKVIVVPNIENIMSLFEPFYKDFRSELEQLTASLSEAEAEVIEKYLSNVIHIMNEMTNKLIGR